MLRLFGIALLLVTAFSTSAQAGILGPLAGLGPVQLEDDDWESQITGLGGLDTTLDVGDILLSVIEIDKSLTLGGSLIQDYSNLTTTITGISALKVISVATTLGGFGAEFKFEGLTSLEWSGLIGLAGITDGTAAILYEDPAATPHIDITTLATGVTTSTEGLKIAEFSVAGPGGWVANTTDAGGAPTDVTKIDSLRFAAGLYTTDPRFALHNALSNPAIGGIDAPFFTGLGDVHLQLTGVNAPGAVGGFQLRTDSDLFVSIVPEPSSMVIFTLLGGLAMVGRARKQS